MAPLAQVGTGLVLLAVTVAIHAAAILVSLEPMRRRLPRLAPLKRLGVQILVVFAIVLGLSIVTLVEAAVWAMALVVLGAIPDFWDAFYFVLVAITTLGFGDVILDDGFRMLGGLCALAGLVSIGMTTAVLIEVLRALSSARWQDGDAPQG